MAFPILLPDIISSMLWSIPPLNGSYDYMDGGWWDLLSDVVASPSSWWVIIRFYKPADEILYQSFVGLACNVRPRCRPVNSQKSLKKKNTRKKSSFPTLYLYGASLWSWLKGRRAATQLMQSQALVWMANIPSQVSQSFIINIHLRLSGPTIHWLE